MTRVVALPTLQTWSGVRPGPWSAEIHGEVVPAVELLDGWDYTVPVAFTCIVDVDVDAVRTECRLESSDRLKLVGIWDCEQAYQRVAATPIDVPASGSYQLRLEPESSAVSGRIRLRRLLALGSSGSSRSPLAATTRGAVLWQEPAGERKTIAVEGEATRFPTESVDFETQPGLEPAAAWNLQIRLDDLDAAALGSVRLLLNERHSAIASLIAGSEDETTRAIADTLEWDVGRRLVQAALDNDEFLDGWGTYTEDSIGQVLQTLIHSTWPQHDGHSLAALRADDQDSFECALQGRFHLFGNLT